MTPTPNADSLADCPECGNAYLAIKTDLYKDKREFIYCDCCGAMATRPLWNLAALAKHQADHFPEAGNMVAKHQAPAPGAQSGGVPVLFFSPKQLEQHDPQATGKSNYLPCVRRAEGLFTMPLYAHPAPQQEVGKVDASPQVREQQATQGAEFERGRQQGMQQERALWQLSASTQEIEAATQGIAKELSDEQIDRVTDAQWGRGAMPNQYQAHRAFARAILRAALAAAPDAPNGAPQEKP